MSSLPCACAFLAGACLATRYVDHTIWPADSHPQCQWFESCYDEMALRAALVVMSSHTPMSNQAFWVLLGRNLSLEHAPSHAANFGLTCALPYAA